VVLDKDRWSLREPVDRILVGAPLWVRTPLALSSGLHAHETERPGDGLQRPSLNSAPVRRGAMIIIRRQVDSSVAHQLRAVIVPAFVRLAGQPSTRTCQCRPTGYPDLEGRRRAVRWSRCPCAGSACLRPDVRPGRTRLYGGPWRWPGRVAARSDRPCCDRSAAGISCARVVSRR
jgi:hypothetical protein